MNSLVLLRLVHEVPESFQGMTDIEYAEELAAEERFKKLIYQSSPFTVALDLFVYLALTFLAIVVIFAYANWSF